MNLDQIAIRISNPNSLIPSETPVLQELAEKYPYAQVFSILYLKSLSMQNDIGFDEALQKQAYRITDRMKLYDLIHNQDAEHEVEEQKADSTIDSNAAITNHSIVDSTIDSTLDSTLEKEEMLTFESKNDIAAEEDDLLQDISSEILYEKGLIDERNKSENEFMLNSEVEIIEKQTLEEVDQELKDFDEIDIDPTLNEISQEIVQDFHAFSNENNEKSSEKESFFETTKDKIDLDGNEIPPLELAIISEIVETIYSDNLEQTIQEVEVVEKKSEINKKIETESKVEISNAKMSFTSWLKSGNNTNSESLKEEIESKENSSQDAVVQSIDIIDNFIKLEPKISKVKKEFYSPSKKAKESISTEGLIYSETLAEIFAIQGNFPKAITAYQQLMLTNPEKKIFFAKRIEELKEKLNT